MDIINDRPNVDDAIVEVIDLSDCSPSRSPDKDCPICLEELENKSYTDICFHAFCFTCLVEWSKVKPVCPLCKESFKSIVHDVKSYSDFKQHYVESSDKSSNVYDGNDRFRYRTTITQNYSRGNASNNDSVDSMNFMSNQPYQLEFARSTSPRSIQALQFRESVYQNNLWVVKSQNTRYRNISPSFFKRNQACTHRLISWLCRELNALLLDDERRVEFVSDLIIELVQRYKIDSILFQEHIRPFLGTRTSHFIHEFLEFARSPYDIVKDYDRQAIYDYNFSNTQQNDININNSITVSSQNSQDFTPINVSNIQSPDVSIESSTNHFSFNIQSSDKTNFSIVTPYTDNMDRILSIYGESSTSNSGWMTPPSFQSIHASFSFTPNHKSESTCVASSSHTATLVCSSDSEVEIIGEKEGNSSLNVIDSDCDVNVCGNSDHRLKQKTVSEEQNMKSRSYDFDTFNFIECRIKENEPTMKLSFNSKHVNKSAKAKNAYDSTFMKYHKSKNYEHSGENHMSSNQMHSGCESEGACFILKKDCKMSSKFVKKSSKHHKHKSKHNKSNDDSQQSVLTKQRKHKKFYSDDSDDEIDQNKYSLKSVINKPIDVINRKSISSSEDKQLKKKNRKRSITPLKYTLKNYEKEIDPNR